MDVDAELQKVLDNCRALDKIKAATENKDSKEMEEHEDDDESGSDDEGSGVGTDDEEDDDYNNSSGSSEEVSDADAEMLVTKRAPRGRVPSRRRSSSSSR